LIKRADILVNKCVYNADILMSKISAERLRTEDTSIWQTDGYKIE